jgi:NADPH:quinone reductase-like Zn-dependent oxidoreductase
MSQYDYLQVVLHHACAHAVGQRALEWAVLSGRIALTYTDRRADVRTLLARYADHLADYESHARTGTLDYAEPELAAAA